MAMKKGYQKISLNVYRDNARAFKLYTNLGFREVAEKSSEENCHMVNRYSSPAVDNPMLSNQRINVFPKHFC
jgi:ribosomal protein S18 acetylase RimI-like enzyme